MLLDEAALDLKEVPVAVAVKGAFDFPWIWIEHVKSDPKPRGDQTWVAVGKPIVVDKLDIAVRVEGVPNTEYTVEVFAGNPARKLDSKTDVTRENGVGIYVGKLDA